MANRGVNKVILIGYLGQEPVIRYMSNGSMVANISVATTQYWKNKKTDEFQEKTEWHRIVLFGKLAEIASGYLHKGSQVYIEGSLQTRKWQDQHGRDRYVTEVIVSIGGAMQILSSRSAVETGILDDTQKQDKSIINQDDEITLSNESDTNFSEEDIPF